MKARLTALFLSVSCCLPLTFSKQSVSESFSRTFDAGGLDFIRLQADRGSVEVTGKDQANIVVDWEIDYRTDSLETVADVRSRIDFAITEEANTFVVKFSYLSKRSWGFFWNDGGPAIKIKLAVPLEMDIALKTSGGRLEVGNIVGDCELKTSGGRIEIEDVVGDVTAKTSGGRIDVENVRGDLVVESSGGAIDVEEAVGSVSAKTSGGSISIEGGTGSISAETTGGSINVESADPDIRRLDLTTMGGSIRIELAETVGGRVELKTQGGSVSVDDHWVFQGDEKRNYMQGQFGSGEAEVRAFTLGGSVRLDTL